MLATDWHNLLRYVVGGLVVIVLMVGGGGELSAQPAADSTVADYLADRAELDAVTNVPPSALASLDASLIGTVLELRGEIIAIINSDQQGAEAPVSCLLLQTDPGVTVPLDYGGDVEQLQVGQRVAVLAKLCDEATNRGHFQVRHLVSENELLAARERQVTEQEGAVESPPTAPEISQPSAPPTPSQVPYDSEDLAVWKEWIGRHNPKLSDSQREKMVRWVLYHSRNYGVDHRLVFSVILSESNFDPDAVSYAGAQGLMQLMPSTARHLNVEDPFYYPENIRGGIEYLAKYLRKFRGESNYRQCALALACYNAGPNAVEKYGGVPPFAETRNYIRQVTQQFYELYKAGYP